MHPVDVRALFRRWVGFESRSLERFQVSVAFIQNAMMQPGGPRGIKS
jgi:hypothetical protein